MDNPSQASNETTLHLTPEQNEMFSSFLNEHSMIDGMAAGHQAATDFVLHAATDKE